MSLANIGSVRSQTLRMLENVPPRGGIELLSYKRDRSAAVVRLDRDRFLVRERGYVEQDVEVGRDGLSRLLKTIIKREFPRSRKVRLFKFTDVAELDREKQRI